MTRDSPAVPLASLSARLPAGPLRALAAFSLLACGSARPPLAGAAPALSVDLAPVASTARPEVATADGAGDPLASPEAPTNVVLVTLDGVRWQEVLDGVDPTLGRWAHLPASQRVDARRLFPHAYERLVDAGTLLGPDAIAVSGPAYVSLAGYLELLRGHAAPGCASNECSFPAEPSLAEQVRAMPGVGADDVAVFASWDRIAPVASATKDAFLVSAGRSFAGRARAAESDAELTRAIDLGASATAMPGHGGYRPDRHTARIALAWLRTHRPRFLWVALGDPDEWAHRGSYADYLGSLGAADAFLGELFATLDAMGDHGRATAVVVTTDHGRGASWTRHGNDPASGPVWLMASGAGLPARGRVHPAEGYHLADVAPTLRGWLGVASSDPRHAALPLGAATNAARPLALVGP